MVPTHRATWQVVNGNNDHKLAHLTVDRSGFAEAANCAGWYQEILVGEDELTLAELCGRINYDVPRETQVFSVLIEATSVAAALADGVAKGCRCQLPSIWPERDLSKGSLVFDKMGLALLAWFPKPEDAPCFTAARTDQISGRVKQQVQTGAFVGW